MNSEYNFKISIGLPVYNGEYFLEKKLNSLLSQTFSDFELIISDNASTDSTSEICKKFVEKDNRIKYYRQDQNMGANWNFNFVLQKACSPYFIWVGVNDEVSKYFLEKNYKVLDAESNVVGSISKIKVKDIQNISHNKSTDDFFTKLIKNWRSLKSIGSYFYDASRGENIWEYYFEPVMPISYEKLSHLLGQQLVAPPEQQV